MAAGTRQRVSDMVAPGLTKVTIAAPRRRVDVALPDQAPVAELLSGLLRHVGEAVPDEGLPHGGWMLRRADGASVASERSLAAQRILDGEVLHLVPAAAVWPEPDYDDVAEAIAGGVSGHVRQWDARATMAFGLTAVGLALGCGLCAILAHGPQWTMPGLVALGVAVLLTLVGAVESRALADARSGAILAAFALPYAFVGGLTVLGGQFPLSHFGPTQLLVAGAVLMLFGVIGYLGVADLGRVFVAGALTGCMGIAWSVIALWEPSAGAAATLATALVAAIAGFPLLALRMAKLPMPMVPQNQSDLADVNIPDRSQVFAASARADELLTGFLLGTAVVHVMASIVLVVSGGAAGRLLVCVIATSDLLRARAFIALWQRLSLLFAGAGALSALSAATVVWGAHGVNLSIVAFVALVLAVVILGATIRYSRRPPSPYLGRLADVADVLLVLAAVPVALAVLGLYGRMRGLGG